MPSDRSPRVTMADVARAADVSVMTVSYCYSRPDRVAADTRDAVTRAALSLGYLGPDPTARSLRNGRAGSIGVILGEHLTYAFDDPQARQFLAGVAAVCRDRSVGLTLIPTTSAEPDAERIRAAAVDGFIVWTTVDSDPAMAAAVRLDKPVAVLGGPETPGAHVVTIDDRAAARAIARTVFQGARRPAVVSFPLNDNRESGLVSDPDLVQVTFPVTRNRLLGIRDYCTDAGIDVGDVLIAVSARNDRAESRDVIDALLDLPDPPDAVLAMSDELAFVTLAALRERGRGVPSDVSVSGWDDGPEAEAAGLSTVHQSLFEQGEQCARIALGELEASEQPSWRLAIRDTTRVLPRMVT
jgi:DNA-binding LacI/PurR family transcriptional regulator